MRQLLFATVVVCSCASMASAQQTSPDAYPKLEIFGGYSANGTVNTKTLTAVSQNQNIASLFSDFGGGPKGFEASVAHNFNKYLGIKADFAMYFTNDSDLSTVQVCLDGSCTTTTLETNVDRRAFYFMAGPEIKARNKTRVTPFAHALFGVVRSTADFSLAGASFNIDDSHTRTGFAYALGGGLDFRVNKRFSVRAMADYSQTFLGAADEDKSGRQNHVRFSLGILFSKP
jgi:opacity protein-like surface antigen